MEKKQIRINKKNTIPIDLIATFAHELKTPVTSIKEAVAMLSDMNKLNPDTKTKRVITIAQEEIDRLIRMIDNFLKISALEIGKIQLSFEKARIEEIIDRVIDSQGIIINRKKIKMRKKFLPNSPKILMDKDRIFEVIANLLDNAVKFTPEHGTITLMTQILKPDNLIAEELYLIPKQKYIKFTISDTGPGIAKKNLSRIFQKFERFDTQSKSGGIGLGLAISKNIIELHNGKIWATSQKKKGTSFHFVIPINP